MKARPHSSASSFEENKTYKGDHKALLASGPSRLWVYALMLRARRSWSTWSVTRLLCFRE